MNAEALKAILDRHRIWLESGRAEGSRAMLAGTCLQGLSFWRAELSDANLEGADLRGANLDHAVLRGTLLRGACRSRPEVWCSSAIAKALTGGRLGGGHRRFR
jgi:uncharacterized protein YjbI with pentapeptide repeats